MKSTAIEEIGEIKEAGRRKSPPCSPTDAVVTGNGRTARNFKAWAFAPLSNDQS